MGGQPKHGPKPRASGTTAQSEESLLLDRYRQLLRKAIGKTVPNAAAYDVDDIEQEACARVLKALRQGSQIQSMDSYVYRIGVTAAIDSLRKVRRRRESLIDDASQVFAEQADAPAVPTPDAALEIDRRLQIARRFIQQLSGNRQAAVVLHLQGHSIEEIARHLGWTENKARNLVYRGMSDLKTRARAAREEP